MICFLVASTYPMQKHNGAFLLECGPSAIIDMTAGRDDTDVDLSIHLPWSPDGAGVIFNSVTVPGLLMSFLWGLLLIGLVFLFDEPLRVNAGDAADDDSSNSGRKGQTNKLGRLVDSTTSLFQVIFENGAFLVSMAPCPSCMASFFMLLISFFRAQHQTTLYLFAFIELSGEIMISSCSMVVREYRSNLLPFVKLLSLLTSHLFLRSLFSMEWIYGRIDCRIFGVVGVTCPLHC